MTQRIKRSKIKRRSKSKPKIKRRSKSKIKRRSKSKPKIKRRSKSKPKIKKRSKSKPKIKRKKLNKKQKLFNKVLLDAKAALDEAGVPFHLHSGTALGAIREQQFIEHDKDIDLAIFAKDYNRKLLPAMKRHGFPEYDSNGKLKWGKEFTFYHKDGIDLDIFFVYQDTIPIKKFNKKSRSKSSKLMYWVPSFYGICDDMKYGMCRWVYRPYKPVKLMLHGTEYLSLPKKSMVDAYGKDWMIPKVFGYSEGIEKDLYKGFVYEPK